MKPARRVELVLPGLFPWQQEFRRLVSESSATFILVAVGRRAGKTTGLTRIAGDLTIGGRFRLGGQDRVERGTVFWGAPTYDLSFIARELFQEWYGRLIRKSENERPRDRMLSGGSVLWRSFDREGGSLGRGFHVSVIEEAARVKGTQVYEELLMTAADRKGKLVAITTPRGQSHWTHDWYRKARDGHPDYACIHGPSTQNPMPQVRDFIRVARETMPDHLFRQEVLAEFIPGEGGVFRNIVACSSLAGYHQAPPGLGRRYIIGCDVAKHQDWTVMYALDVDTGEVHGVDRFQHCPWPLVEERIRTFHLTWNRGTVFLDSTGVGDAVYDHLVEKGVPCVPVVWSSASKDVLVMRLALALERGAIAFPADDILTGELETYHYDISATGRFRYTAPDGKHDDCVAALALAVYGRHHRTPGDLWTQHLAGLLAQQPHPGT